ncbi:Gfo/Idh/MocA family protein [Halalkalibacter krulwichiae]|uniref:1,5-anhydro-D-fructose reductase n=1 Tax=Halalkalibacter krulwichiae TaxID=199441 RepID=A0A1X9M6P7_9BACI|nr:Gfo/Idh/MocA family oxidoreductase [Halalkalibacter krulwichiae]ARK29108.1 1,5-anhydro-D-fructose reductase [Halalkalibacter krulwichiae]
MIRFAVIGTNWITENFIKAARKVEGFELTAVYSRTKERGQLFADQYNAPFVYTSLEEVATSSEVDAVYIASPNSHHANQAILMMNNGKHVLCEKPLASNTAEVERMITCAKENDVLLMEALKTTFVPNFNEIKKHIKKIGTVRRYVSSYCQYSSRYDRYKAGEQLNTFDPQFSNGALMDLGVYCVYPLVALFGEPKQVLGQSYMLESGVDGEGSLLLKYDQMEAVIMYSKISNSYLPSEIQGEEGSILIDHMNPPKGLKIQYRNGTSEQISLPQDEHSMLYEIEEFISLVKNNEKESNINTYENSLITARILEEARMKMNIVYPADRANKD